MGDINQKLYLQNFVKNVNGPILEIGSKDYGNTQNFRDMFPNNEYTGIDLSDGKGVDLVLDLTKTTEPLNKNHFSLIICCSVLEHTPVPWVMAQNITSLLRKGGALYISVPWVWRYHPYPDDYFRFSANGIKSLFPDYQWIASHWSTYITGEFAPIHSNKNDFDSQLSLMADTPKGKRKYLPYLMVNMIGTAP
ncbi:class I SAM-dependent methyltransferase [Candidatus Albibeggiatoa sp. nov. NOAA]|uniref:class I SAM-dependent methyltransferase n=1 Tax=Candidatus Albibeggiatoa sp. nov. NOAA TaxID=3162724 RepID=UPI0032F71C90|nr:class I SAM-dependent methyltransferase [Thiotrichaceae bacterium]